MLGKLMEMMTWKEVAEAIKEVPFMLVPLGARQKEHGLHLPLNTDYLLAEYFRDRLLEKNSILSAGVIDINFYPAFTEYPGTEHLSFDIASELVYQKCKSHIAHGITHIYVINIGISTNKVLSQLQTKFKQENIVFAFTDLTKYGNDPRIKAIETQKCGTHADELETSMMLYIKPQVVKMEKAIKDDSECKSGPLTRSPTGYGIYSSTGAWGDPTLATVEKGEIIVNTYLKWMDSEVKLLLKDCLMKNH